MAPQSASSPTGETHEATFEAVAGLWFDLIGDGSDSVNLDATSFLELVSGVQLVEGALGQHTPSPLQEPTHLADLGDVRGGSRNLGRAEWLSAIRGCREAWGPSLFLRKAAAATGHGRSLIGLLLADGRKSRRAAGLAVLSAARAQRPQERAVDFARRALPDGSKVATLLENEEQGDLNVPGIHGFPRAIARGSGAAAAAAISANKEVQEVLLVASKPQSLPSLSVANSPEKTASTSAGSTMALDSTLSSTNNSIGDTANARLLEALTLEPCSCSLVTKQPLYPLDAAVSAAETAGGGAAVSVGNSAASGINNSSKGSSAASGHKGAAHPFQEPKPPASSSAPPWGTGSSSASSSSSTMPLATVMPCQGGGASAEAGAGPEPPDGALASASLGKDLSEGNLIKYGAAGNCCVCLESFQPNQLWRCGRPDCTQGYCSGCLKQHAETVVATGIYAVPSVRCPGCNRRIGTSSWAEIVGQATLSKYRGNAHALLIYRCASCDETSSFFSATPPTVLEPVPSLEPAAKARLLADWRRFFLGETTAEDFLQRLLVEHGCGHRSGGVAPARALHTLGASGSAAWIRDLERRLALQVAFLHRFPKQRTPCCAERFCFRCKVSSWHRGISCEERISGEKARTAQFCPGCGVPTVRSEGCRKMVCVCGRTWEWEGNDSSSEGTLEDSDDESEGGDGAQSAMNLVAMNAEASEENVKTLVKILVDAGADVNAATGLQEQTPLLLATQCRHVAAVAALCEHNARVTSEVLEEVKGISSPTIRHLLEELLRPRIQSDPMAKLPLWAWVQAGSAAAVEALLRNANHEEEIDIDVLVALQRSRGDDSSRDQIADRIRDYVGEERFGQLKVNAASRCLLHELREAYDEERDPDLEIIKNALSRSADANAREETEEEDEADDGYELTAMGLLAMNRKASPESIKGAVAALVEANADVNLESDQSGTPLLSAVQHRNLAAIEAFCDLKARFTTDILDELKTLSDTSQRHQIEDLLQPLIIGNQGHHRLPLWVWVQGGSVSAVEALLWNSSHEEEINTDVLVAVQRCRGDEESQKAISERIREHIGDERFSKLMVSAATRRLLQELREAYDEERDPEVSLLSEALMKGADPNIWEDGEGEEYRLDESFHLPALGLVAMNTAASSNSIERSIESLLEAKGDANKEVNECTPLLTAVQHRNLPAMRALLEAGAKVTSEVLEEAKDVSKTETRVAMEEALQPWIRKDKSLRCPLWLWVQEGNSIAVEALIRNANHEEDINTDVLVALQRTRGDEKAREQIAERIKEHIGEEEFVRLSLAAASRRLLQELREAYEQERDPDIELVKEALEKGADANAREEMDEVDDDIAGGDDDEEEEEDEEEDDDEDDEDDDDDEEDDDEGAENDEDEDEDEDAEDDEENGDNADKSGGSGSENDKKGD